MDIEALTQLFFNSLYTAKVYAANCLGWTEEETLKDTLNILDMMCQLMEEDFRNRVEWILDDDYMLMKYPVLEDLDI